jgi:ABC-2 type transport system ATP-binding protein
LTAQNAAVDIILTGRENLRLIGKLRHLPDANKKADALLEQFDLLEAADRQVATYSGGMRRRLDLAMGLLGAPSVVFLDEPTTGLDPQSRRTMWNVIKDLARSGITVFLTTQHLEEAEQLADQIVILLNRLENAGITVAEFVQKLPALEDVFLAITGENHRAERIAVTFPLKMTNIPKDCGITKGVKPDQCLADNQIHRRHSPKSGC